MRIHIIEDNIDLQGIFESTFGAAGHEVQVSSDGLSGITDTVEFKPDVVLLDLMMPELDGFGFLSALKNNTSMRPLVVVCSNLGQQSDIDKATAAGADAYLRKSDYVGDALVKAVEKAYEEHLKQQPSDNSTSDTPPEQPFTSDYEQF